MNLIQAQRLVRRVCSSARSDVTAEVLWQALIDAGFSPGQIGAFRS